MEKGMGWLLAEGQGTGAFGTTCSPCFFCLHGGHRDRQVRACELRKKKIPLGSFVNVDFWDLCLHHLILAFFRAGLPHGMEQVWHFCVPFIAI